MALSIVGISEMRECGLKYVMFSHYCKTNEAVCPSDCIRWLAILLSVHVSSGKLLFMLG